MRLRRVPTLDTLSRLKGDDALVFIISLDTLSRLKGMETSLYLIVDVEKCVWIFGYAFPFEGNGNTRTSNPVSPAMTCDARSRLKGMETLYPSDRKLVAQPLSLCFFFYFWYTLSYPFGWHCEVYRSVYLPRFHLCRGINGLERETPMPIKASNDVGTSVAPLQSCTLAAFQLLRVSILQACNLAKLCAPQIVPARGTRMCLCFTGATCMPNRTDVSPTCNLSAFKGRWKKFEMFPAFAYTL